MILFEGIFNWEGFGGKLSLASGKCYMKIIDLSKERSNGLVHLKPFIVIAKDHADSNMSIRSCSSHIATLVSKRFNISPNRMQFIEYYPQKTYGQGGLKTIPENFEGVVFTWKEGAAIHPRLQPLEPLLLKRLAELMDEYPESENSPNT